MFGRWFFAAVVAVCVIIIGMLLYPTVHTNISGIDVSGFIPLTQAGLVVMEYAFIPIVAYLIYAHIRK